MSDARSAWNDAGERLQSLGASLKQHYEARQEGGPAPEGKPVADAFAQVGEALQGAFDALGASAKDPVVKDEAKAAGRSVAEALAATLGEASEGLKRAFEGDGDAPPSQSSPTDSDPTRESDGDDGRTAS